MSPENGKKSPEEAMGGAAGGGVRNEQLLNVDLDRVRRLACRARGRVEDCKMRSVAISMSGRSIPRVALVTHDFCGPSSGVFSKTLFTMRVLEGSGRYETEVINLPTSSRDPYSILLRNPRTWTRKLGQIRRQCGSVTYSHVGAFLGEMEFQRYRPREPLSGLLRTFDVIQLVVGAPPWVCTVPEGLSIPVFLYVATLTIPDRTSRLESFRGWRRLWLSAMTPIVVRMEKEGLKRADHVFAVSSYTYDALLPQVGPERMSFAPCGVDTDFFHPARFHELEAGERFILSVGRLNDPRKNVRNLLEAYSELLSRQTSCPDLYLVGTPPGAPDLGVLAEKRFQGKVKVLGAVSKPRLAELFRRADIFVLSSDEEGLGIVLLEAMASGTPVVSTACGGPATSVDDGRTGFLVPPRTPGALADALSCLVADASLRMEMGRRARQAAVERFSVPATGKAILSVYDRLLGQGP